MELSGNLIDYLAVFWGGVLVSFTPCVYPLLPVTAGFIAGLNTDGSRLRGFFISLVYVLGVAVTYCCLAVFAALTGKIFGQVQNNPWLYLFVGNVLLFFALVMLDIIPLPYINLGVQNKIKLKSMWSVLFFGMVSGLMIGPCTAPVLGSLLAYVTTKQNVLHGVSLMFFFSYGVGATLILAGTFSGFLASLPKSGPWMIRIKQISAAILIVAAQYYILKAGALF